VKHFSSLLVVAAALALASFGAGCGTAPPPSCSPTTCEGCCDAQGVCRTGDTDLACGLAGVRCNTCSNIQSCLNRSCVLLGVDAGSDAGVDGGSEDAGTPICARTTVACSDQAILQLDLKTAVAPGLITNLAADGGFKSIVDAVAGGSPPTDSYVYAKFTSTGLQKVALGDQAALDAFDWDIAFRRFVIRLNGGDSGPACTAAAMLPPGTPFDSVTSLPAIASYPVDDFLTASPTCGFVDDGSGLPSSPATALASYYGYTNCVTMTGRVFIVQTRLGRHLKLEITGYYQSEAAQATCNSGAAPGVPGGTIRLRWAFLD
jgi:HmuY protein